MTAKQGRVGKPTGLSQAEPVSRLGPAGFDPSRKNVAFGISSSACFCPEDDNPEDFDGRMITWTFAVPKSVRIGAGIYRLELVRVLTPGERGNTTAQLNALDVIAMEARSGETAQTGSTAEGGDSAGLQGIAQQSSGDNNHD